MAPVLQVNLRPLQALRVAAVQPTLVALRRARGKRVGLGWALQWAVVHEQVWNKMSGLGVFLKQEGSFRNVPRPNRNLSWVLGVGSPFFSTIVLSKNRICFLWVSGGFLERRIPDPRQEWGRYP